MIDYNIGGRVYQASELMLQELRFAQHANYIFELKHLAIIKVTGHAAAEFLQGQLTCDIRLVTHNRMQVGALCNLKGRILVLLDVICWHDALFLILPKDLVSEILLKLAKIALLSRVVCAQLSNMLIYGIYVNNYDIHAIQQLIGPTAYVYNIAINMYIIVTAEANSIQNIHATYKSALAWHFLELQAHRYTIYPKTLGLFLPHKLNLHNMGYISLTKGCYRGQEIIARMHHRTNLANYRCDIAILNLDHVPRLGEKLLAHDGNDHSGTIFDYAPTNILGQYLIGLHK